MLCHYVMLCHCRKLSSKNEQEKKNIKIKIDPLILNQLSLSKTLMRKSIYCVSRRVFILKMNKKA